MHRLTIVLVGGIIELGIEILAGVSCKTLRLSFIDFEKDKMFIFLTLFVSYFVIL